ncbi:MAG TPA: hypothetical protein VHV83_17155 [Armatimonadota bacterium]|nr:hypothetical protein [Armatimonadota bacterium]
MIRSLIFLSSILTISILIAGCARFPSTGNISNAPSRTLYSEITLQDRINPNYYYFLALDTDQNTATGPVPVVTGYGYTNGWGTIAPTPPDENPIEPPFYVEFHNGIFEQYRNGQPLSPPFRSGLSEDGKTLWVEIDESLLDPLIGSVSSPIVQLNWITMEDIDPSLSEGDRKQYDGFGRTGNDYLDAVTLKTAMTWTSGEGTIPVEYPYGVEEQTTSNEAIDIVHWQVQTKIQTQSTAVRQY